MSASTGYNHRAHHQGGLLVAPLPSVEMRCYRKAAGLSQRELGWIVGCFGPYIAQIETGTKIPTYDLDTRRARALRLTGAEDFYSRRAGYTNG